MSTAARKARKRSPIAADRKLVRSTKVGTPAIERTENQPRSFYVPGSFVFKRFGLSSGAARRLTARDIEVGAPVLSSAKLSRAERAEVKRFGLDRPE